MAGKRDGAMNATVTPITRDWHWSAACRTADPDLFHAPDSDTPEPEQARITRESAALAVCKPCPARIACLNDALALRPSRDRGVAGGLTEDERARYRRTITRQYLAARRKAA